MNQFSHIKDLETLVVEVKRIHSELERQYYDERLIDKNTFDILHSTLWSDYEEQKEVIQPHKYMTDEELKEEYNTTVTIARKSEITEELLGLRERSVVKVKLPVNELLI